MKIILKYITNNQGRKMKIKHLLFTTALTALSISNNYSMEDNYITYPFHTLLGHDSIDGKFSNAADIKLRFLSAVAEDQIEDAKKLILKHNVDINTQYYNGRTALHMLAQRRNSYAINYNCNFHNINCNCNLHNSIKMLKFLIDNDANINAEDINGKTALHIAIEAGHGPLLEYLIYEGADINPDIDNDTIKWHLDNYSKLEKEARDNPTLKTLEKIIKSGDFPYLTYQLLCEGITPTKEHIRLATWRDHKEIASLLIEYLGFFTSTSRISLTGMAHKLPKNAVDIIARQYIKNKYGFNFISYKELKKEISTQPSAKTFAKMIGQGDFPHLVRQLILSNIIPTKDDLALAQQHHRKNTVIMLKKYLGITGPELTIAKNGMQQAFDAHNVPAEIAHKIASYTL
jgi:Ankyrin repeats (3 copies)